MAAVVLLLLCCWEDITLIICNVKLDTVVCLGGRRSFLRERWLQLSFKEFAKGLLWVGLTMDTNDALVEFDDIDAHSGGNGTETSTSFWTMSRISHANFSFPPFFSLPSDARRVPRSALLPMRIRVLIGACKSDVHARFTTSGEIDFAEFCGWVARKKIPVD